MTEKPTEVIWMEGGSCYHRPAAPGQNWVKDGCRWAGTGNRGTREEAVARGLRACGLCYHESYRGEMDERAVVYLKSVQAQLWRKLRRLEANLKATQESIGLLEAKRP